MNIKESLEIGQLYSKKELSVILINQNISLVREGIYHLNEEYSLLFIDLEKDGKAERFHFNNFYENDFFHWDSQTTQHVNSPKLKEFIDGKRTALMFVRVRPKIKSKTQPYVYCGRMIYNTHDPETSKPVHIIGESLDYEFDTKNEHLKAIYNWHPKKAKVKSNVKLDYSRTLSNKRKNTYKKPNKTERRGLVTSRIGQGYYRQEVLKKWGFKCALTRCEIQSILIASHIVPWSQSNNEERVDPENSILLAPNVDALFDQHLISFDDEGKLITADYLNKSDLKDLGIKNDSTIKVTHGMRKYLKRHRTHFNQIKTNSLFNQ